ncbi:MAG: gluconokinase, partial [Planctomycetota bacterium]
MNILVMGVAGTGKSTIASGLAERLGAVFLEADDFHPESNRAKMASGVPLTDADREPWIEALCDAIRAHTPGGGGVSHPPQKAGGRGSGTRPPPDGGG